MATVAYVSDHPAFTSIGISGYKWTPLTNANLDGSPLMLRRRTDRSVQVTGTFDGCTVTIQGSLDGTNWFTLNDLQSTALTFTSARLEGVSEICTFIRPLVSAAGAATSITVNLVEVGDGG